MKEDDCCPYCSESITIEFTDDYWETEQGEEADTYKCPECNEIISISWETVHYFNFNKRGGRED